MDTFEKAARAPSRSGSEGPIDEKEYGIMGSTSDKVKGVANEAMGNAKQGIGKVVGSEKMQAEGKAQELKGEGQQAMGKAKEAVKDTVDKAAGAVHRKM